MIEQNQNNGQAPKSHILDTDYEILGYNDKLTYTEMYRVLFYSLASLHRQSLRFEAIEMFNDCIGDFKPLWDAIFMKNFKRIEEDYPDPVSRYRLHRAELVSLMQRASMVELPDMRYDSKPSWDVPKTVADLEV